MKRVSIKQAFGGEVPFTKYISNTETVAKRLLDSIDEGMGESFTIKPEDETLDRKRVDLVVRDDDNNVIQVIESQDATGWLDSVHASKIAYYCYEKGCMDGVLLTEDADEHIKGFIRWYNENTPLNIYLFNVVIYETDNGPYVDFVPVMRPFNIKDKKYQRKSNTRDDNDNFGEFLKQKMNDHPGKFTHQTNWYVSKNNIKGLGINAGIHCRKSGYFIVDLYHNKKYHNNKTFEDSFKEHMDDDNIHIVHTRAQVGHKHSWEDAIKAFDHMVEGLEQGKIKVA